GESANPRGARARLAGGIALPNPADAPDAGQQSERAVRDAEQRRSADEGRSESDRLAEWTNRQEPQRLKDERDQPVVAADARAGVLGHVFLQQRVPPGVGQLPGAEPEQECACDEQNWRWAHQG